MWTIGLGAVYSILGKLDCGGKCSVPYKSKLVHEGGGGTHFMDKVDCRGGGSAQFIDRVDCRGGGSAQFIDRVDCRG